MSGVQVDLFANEPLIDVLGLMLNRAVSSVATLPEDRFSQDSRDAVVAYVCDNAVHEPLELLRSSAKLEIGGRQRVIPASMPGYETIPPEADGLIAVDSIALNVPFTGHSAYWSVKPTGHNARLLSCGVVERDSTGIGNLRVRLLLPEALGPEHAKSTICGIVDQIEVVLSKIKLEIVAWTDTLRKAVEEEVDRILNLLDYRRKIANVFGIPLMERPESPRFFVPIERRLVRPLPPPVSRPSEPMFEVRIEDYEHILGVIRHVSASFSCFPKIYQRHGEEDLRSIILSHLRGHYVLEASAEAFRCNGKTDIQIMFQGQSAFVAECKIWNGAGKIEETIDQLFGYLTWMDSKAAVVYFNKHVAQFSTVVKTVCKYFEKHQRTIKVHDRMSKGETRVLMRSPGDSGHSVLVHVFVMNVFAGTGGHKSKAPVAKRSRTPRTGGEGQKRSVAKSMHSSPKKVRRATVPGSRLPLKPD